MAQAWVPSVMAAIRIPTQTIWIPVPPAKILSLVARGGRYWTLLRRQQLEESIEEETPDPAAADTLEATPIGPDGDARHSTGD